MDIESCLPPELRGPTTAISKIGAGMSGAGVYRIEAAGQVFVLKTAGEHEPAPEWRRRLHIQRLAADAGLAPQIVHADEDKRAVVTAFVVDRSFPTFFMNPQTQDAAIVQLARTIRRVHDLPLLPDARSPDRRELLNTVSRELETRAPRFVRDAIDRALREPQPRDDRAPVLSHNDLNPSNIVYDGDSIVLLDWQTAGPMHPHWDLATIAMFLRMSDATCLKLLSAYEGATVESLPATFVHARRLAAAACGALFVQLALQMKHPDATEEDTVESALALADVYQQMRTGAVNLASADGQWAFGLALLKQSLAL